MVHNRGFGASNPWEQVRDDRRHDEHLTPWSQLTVLVMLLCVVKGCCGLEESVEVAGDVAFECADGFAACFAFGDASLDVGLGAGVGACSGECDGVDGVVESSVAAPLEAAATARFGHDQKTLQAVLQWINVEATDVGREAP